MNFKWKQFFRALVFPLLLSAVYLAQLQYPRLFKQYALWSEHPRWWQFFTNGFLSGNPVHLLINVCGVWAVCAYFASQIRLYFLFLYFVLFSAVSSFLYFHFFMPSHAWLVGASGGVYALIGFLCWFLRRDRVCFAGSPRFAFRLFPVILISLLIEFLVAIFWIRVLAWQLHVIAFGVSMFVVLILHAADELVCWLARRERSTIRRIFAPLSLAFQKIKAAATLKEPIAE